jgi:hypothetical protein
VGVFSSSSGQKYANERIVAALLLFLCGEEKIKRGAESPPLLAMGFLPLGQKNKVMKETGAVAMMHYG